MNSLQGHQFTLNGFDYHIISARFLVTQIDDWDYQRPINEGHIKELMQHAPNFPDPFKLVKCNFDNGKLLLVDGQHRRDAIKNCMLGDSVADFEILVQVKTVESESEIVRYFKSINNYHPINFESIPKLKYVKFVEEFKKNYPQISEDSEVFSSKEFLHELQKLQLLDNDKIMDIIKSANCLMGVDRDVTNYVDKKIDSGAGKVVKNSGCYIMILGVENAVKMLAEIAAENDQTKMKTIIDSFTGRFCEKESTEDDSDNENSEIHEKILNQTVNKKKSVFTTKLLENIPNSTLVDICRYLCGRKTKKIYGNKPMNSSKWHGPVLMKDPNTGVIKSKPADLWTKSETVKYRNYQIALKFYAMSKGQNEKNKTIKIIQCFDKDWFSLPELKDLCMILGLKISPSSKSVLLPRLRNPKEVDYHFQYLRNKEKWAVDR